MYAGSQDSSWVEPELATALKLAQLGARVTVTIVANEEHVIGSLTGSMLFEVLGAYAKLEASCSRDDAGGVARVGLRQGRAVGSELPKY